MLKKWCIASALTVLWTASPDLKAAGNPTLILDNQTSNTLKVEIYSYSGDGVTSIKPVSVPAALITATNTLEKWMKGNTWILTKGVDKGTATLTGKLTKWAIEFPAPPDLKAGDPQDLLRKFNIQVWRQPAMGQANIGADATWDRCIFDFFTLDETKYAVGSMNGKLNKTIVAPDAIHYTYTSKAGVKTITFTN